MIKPCPYCGTRTGLHGFSFNKNGSYKEPKVHVVDCYINDDPRFPNHVCPVTPEKE